MKHAVIALITGGIVAWLPMWQLTNVENAVCVVAIWFVVRFGINDIDQTIRRHRRKKQRRKIDREKDDFAGLMMKATLPGKQHTLSVDTLRRVA